MTLSTITSRVSYAGNGGTTSFAFAFKIWAPANLKVYVRDNATLADSLQTLGTHYSVDILSYSNTGNVVFATAPALGKTIVIVRDMPLTQDLDLVASGAFAAENVETQLDKLAAEIQTLREKIARTPQIPIGSTLADVALPEPRASFAGKLIGFDATGLALAAYSPTALGASVLVTSFAASLLDDEDAAEAYQTIRPRGTVYETTVTAPPMSEGNAGSISTAFTGDLSKMYFPVKHSITGATTLGQPTSGYKFTPEVCPHYTFLFNSSGHNEALGGNDGRTSSAAYYTRTYNAGQGDCVAYHASAFVIGTKAGSTNFLANPACGLFTGGCFAGEDGVYLNPGEFLLQDQGRDAAGVGWVVNLDRTVGTGAKAAWWAGFRVQSIGTVEISTAFSATGKAQFGLDLSFLTLSANKAAINLKADQRIYLNVTATDSTGLSRFPSAVNGDFIDYTTTGITGVRVVVGNAPVGMFTSAGVTTVEDFRVPTGKGFRVAGNYVVQGRKTGWAVPTGTLTRTTYATFTGQTIANPPTQMEVQNIDNHVKVLSERLAALISDLHQTAGHGLIGT